jgi:hypothetical protein
LCERFWYGYPRKTGREGARKKKEGKETITLKNCGQGEAKRSQQNTKGCTRACPRPVHLLFESINGASRRRSNANKRKTNNTKREREEKPNKKRKENDNKERCGGAVELNVAQDRLRVTRRREGQREKKTGAA